MNYINFCDLKLIDYLKIFKLSFFLKKRNLKIKKNVFMFFEKNSTRTNMAFEIASKEIGSKVIKLNKKKSQLIRGESFNDTIKIISIFNDIIVCRCKKKKMEKIKKISKIPVINALNENEHPTQIINDLFTFLEFFKNFKKKTITWVGKKNNVFNSLKNSSEIFNFRLNTLYKKNKDYKKFYKNSNAVMTDTWNSMYSEKKKGNFLTVKKKYFKYTNKKCIFLHCLPMYVGKEVEKKVINSKMCKIWKQAKNKIITCKAILYYFLIGRK
ncbi:hypothetical protein [Candidatus Vidania fulgoroideorum]